MGIHGQCFAISRRNDRTPVTTPLLVDVDTDRELLKLLQEEYESLPVALLAELAASAALMTAGASCFPCAADL